MTLSMPDDVHKAMRGFTEVKWSEVARRAIIDKVETLRLADKFASKSKLTQKVVDGFSEKIKLAAAKRFKDGARF